MQALTFSNELINRDEGMDGARFVIAFFSGVRKILVFEVCL